MAHLAAQTHKSSMNFRLLMAGRANNLAFLNRLTGMAVGAYQFCVFAGQLKNGGMVKGLHAIHAVMAIGAGAAKRSHMAGHKIDILGGMAVLAGKGCRVTAEGRMALQAGDRIAAEASRMYLHRKTGLLMIERLALPGGWQPGLSLVAFSAIIGKYPGMYSRFLMAGGTFRAGC